MPPASRACPAALVALLVTLILRNMGLEYRHKRHDREWVRRWDLAIVGGSYLAPFVVGLRPLSRR